VYKGGIGPQSVKYLSVALSLLVFVSSAAAGASQLIPWKALGFRTDSCAIVAVRLQVAVSLCPLELDGQQQQITFAQGATWAWEEHASTSAADSHLRLQTGFKVFLLERAVSTATVKPIPPAGSLTTVVYRRSIQNAQTFEYQDVWRTKAVRMGGVRGLNLVQVGTERDNVEDGLVFYKGALVALIVSRSVRTEVHEYINYPIRAGQIVPGRAALAIPATTVMQWLQRHYRPCSKRWEVDTPPCRQMRR
jgi:hypothetical protein